MHRRTALILGGLVILSGIGIAAFLAGQNVQRVDLGDDAEAADQVTLYQNGIAFVELHRTFNASQGEALLELPVPATTVVDSLRISGQGVSIKEIRSAPDLAGPMQPGDEVVIHVQARTYEGTLVAQREGRLILADGSGTVMVEEHQIEAIEILGRNLTEADPTATRVGILAEVPAGASNVTITYLAHGPRWTPSYDLDLETGQASFFATLTGLHTWSNVTLELVSGSPHMVAQPVPYPSPSRSIAEDAAGGGAQAPSYDVDIGASTPLGELHRYRLDRPIDLVQGEQVRLPVRIGELEIDRRYHQVRASVSGGYSQGETQQLQVLERYQVTNTFEDPLPPGIVRMYRQGTWVAEDLLSGVPSGQDTNLTAAEASEVTAELVLSALESTASREERTYRLTIENHKASGQAIDLQAALSIPTYRTNLLSAQPEPTRQTGAEAIWDTNLEADDAATFRLTYEQLRT